MYSRLTGFNSRTATPEQLDAFRRAVVGAPQTAETLTKFGLDGVIYSWKTPVRGREAQRLVAFSGRRTKPDTNIYTYDTALAEREVSSFFAGLERAAAWKAQQRAVNHQGPDLSKYVEGAILRYSFGYDMTTNHYYQIVRVKGRSIVIRRIASAVVHGDGGYSGTERPIKDAFLDDEPELTKRVTLNGVKIEHKHAYLWDGRPNYFNNLD